MAFLKPKSKSVLKQRWKSKSVFIPGFYNRNFEDKIKDLTLI